jgi:hypothetical protein
MQDVCGIRAADWAVLGGRSTLALGMHMTQTPTSDVQVAAAVRWPFRVLAGLICVAALVGYAGTGLALWSGHRLVDPERFLLLLPGVLWLFRLAAHAAMHGLPVRQPSWPFASAGVLFAYMVITLVCLAAHA